MAPSVFASAPGAFLPGADSSYRQSHGVRWIGRRRCAVHDLVWPSDRQVIGTAWWAHHRQRQKRPKLRPRSRRRLKYSEVDGRLRTSLTAGIVSIDVSFSSLTAAPRQVLRASSRATRTAAQSALRSGDRSHSLKREPVSACRAFRKIASRAAPGGSNLAASRRRFAASAKRDSRTSACLKRRRSVMALSLTVGGRRERYPAISSQICRAPYCGDALTHEVDGVPSLRQATQFLFSDQTREHEPRNMKDLARRQR